MRTVDTKQYLDTVCRMLRDGVVEVPVPVTGTSMVPFLHPGDMAYLSLPDSALKKGDIVLFTRPDGQYVLHRIVKVGRDGSFLMLGDAQVTKEPVPSRDRIHARVTAVRRREKLIRPGDREWELYAGPWVALAPLRRQIGWMHGILNRKK